MNIASLVKFRKQKKAKAPSMVTASAEFQHQFVHTTDRLLRKRFFWFCVVLGGLQAIGLLVLVATAIFGAGTDKEKHAIDITVGVGFSIVQLVSCAAGVVLVKRVRMSRENMIRASQWLVIAVGFADFTSDAMLASSPWAALGSFMVVHFVACLVLPWTPKQALTPAYGVLALFAAIEIVRLSFGKIPVWMLGFDLMSVFAVLPGIAICSLRHSSRMKKFKMGFLQDRYTDMRRELYGAQQIHESIFPDEILDGDVQLRYEYQPMRQIGGDFLFIPPVRKDGEHRRATHLVMLDVTGHGIGAALTVNRLHGELERLFAEDPDIPPDEVMRKINRYIHLTLAIHSVYATGVAISIDHENNEMSYASAGHPPSFLRGVDGSLEDLESTGLMLGVSRAEDYSIAKQSRKFVPGDVLVAYTDGVIECRNDKNRMIGVDGLRQTLASTSREYTFIKAIIAMVDSHRAAMANDDDVLVVEVTRTLRT